MVSDVPPKPERDIVADLRLHPDRTPVTRLSRKVLIGLALVAIVAVLGAVFWALDMREGRRQTESELYNTEHKTTADELAKLPRDYTGVPRNVPPLGPPLPGDFGRPVVQQQGPQRIDAEQQRLAQEAEAARTSRLFEPSTTVNRAQPSPPSRAAPIPPSEAASEKPPIDPDSIQNMQDRKLAFLNGPVDKRTVSTDRLEAPASKYLVQAGSVIPAALLTGIRSDLPGQVTGQVTENVYDSPTGRYLLIPQGSKLIGLYDSQVSFGQSRVLLVWTRLIFPNGRSIMLERQAGADPAGFAGLEDQIDYHWGQLFMAAALSTLLGVGSELGASNNDSDIIQALRRGSSDSLNQTGQQIVRRNLNIQPTLTIRPGFPVRVIVNRDMVFPQENTRSYSDGQTMPTGDGAGAPRP
jgi:type IV secretory pathway VirB10-like protein